MRKMLKVLNRQYTQYNKILIMQKNNLIALLDSRFPNVNILFSSSKRESNGNEKWVDFVLKCPHIGTASKRSLSAFKAKYKSWCKNNRYNYSKSKATQIHGYSRTQVSLLPMMDAIVKIVEESAKLYNSDLKS